MREFYRICSFEVITLISEIEKSKKIENRVSEFKRHVLILIQSLIKLTFNLCDMTRVFFGDRLESVDEVRGKGGGGQRQGCQRQRGRHTRFCFTISRKKFVGEVST